MREKILTMTPLPSSSSSSSSYLLVLRLWAITTTVAILSSFPSFVADAWILKSTGTGRGLATGLVYERQHKSYFISGTFIKNYADNHDFWDLHGIAGATTTTTTTTTTGAPQGFVVHATTTHDNDSSSSSASSSSSSSSSSSTVVKKVSASTFSSLHTICVGGGAVPIRHGNIGFAGIMGINVDGDPMLYTLTKQQVVAGTTTITFEGIIPQSRLALPKETIPVALTSMENRYVFVATMHTSSSTSSSCSVNHVPPLPFQIIKSNDDDDPSSSSNNKNNNNNLIGLVDYWNSFLTQQQQAPPINNHNNNNNNNTNHTLIDYIEIVKFDAENISFDAAVTSEFSRLEVLNDGTGGSAVVVSAMETYQDPMNYDHKILLIAGSTTNGVGDAFGGHGIATSSNSNISDDGGASNDEWWDGYLTWVDADTGTYEYSKRLDVFLPGSNDFVNDICVEGDIVYVVGFSRRQETVLDEVDVTLLDNGFLIAIDINTHEELWKVEMGGRPVKCVAGGGSVYVGRYVSKTYIAGGAPIHTQNIIISSHDDNSADGTVIHTEKWAKEIDTTTDAPTDIRDDYLVDLVLDTHEAGGLVALINSMDTTLGLNDVILLDFLRVSGRNAITDGEEDTNSNPDNEDLPDGTGRPGNDIIPSSPDRDPTRAPIVAPFDPEAIKEEDERDTVIYLAIFIPLLLGLWVIAYHVSCNKANEKEVVQLQANMTTATPAANGANDDSSPPEETAVRQIV